MDFIKKNRRLLFVLVLLSLLITFVFVQNISFITKQKASGQQTQLAFVTTDTDLKVGDEQTILLSATFSVAPAQRIDYAKVYVTFPNENFEIESIDTTNSSLSRKIYVDTIDKANSDGVIVIEQGAGSVNAGPSTSSTLTLASIKVKALKDGSNLDFAVDESQSEVVLSSSQDTTINAIDKSFEISELTPTPTQTPAPTPTSEITSNSSTTTDTTTIATTENTTLNLKVSLQGVTGIPQEASAVTVKVYLYSDSLENPISFSTPMMPTTTGVYEAKIISSEIPAGNNYYVLIKGPKHLARKFCENTVAATDAYTYSCTNEAIAINSGENTLDFISLPLLAGDLSPQDGVLNAGDISTLTKYLFKTDVNSLDIADLNYDGVVNSSDLTLMLVNMNKIYEEDK